MNKKQIREALGSTADRVIFKADGSVEARHSYFYRHGHSAEAMAESIRKILPTASILETTDNWAPWPRDSYFKVVFRMEEVHRGS